MQGYLSIVLHAHLPYVRHPEHPKFLEESWLYEAITETYLPIVQMLENWQRDGEKTNEHHGSAFGRIHKLTMGHKFGGRLPTSGALSEESCGCAPTSPE